MKFKRGTYSVLMSTGRVEVNGYVCGCYGIRKTEDGRWVLSDTVSGTVVEETRYLSTAKAVAELYTELGVNEPSKQTRLMMEIHRVLKGRSPLTVEKVKQAQSQLLKEQLDAKSKQVDPPP